MKVKVFKICTVFTAAMLTFSSVYAEEKSDKLKVLDILSTSDNTRYFVDPDIPAEIAGMSREEVEQMKKFTMRDSWYFTFKAGFNPGPLLENVYIGPEVVINAFDHVGLGAGAGYYLSDRDGDIKGFEYDMFGLLSYYLLAKIYYYPRGSIATPYLILHYGKTDGDLTASDSYYEWGENWDEESELSSGKYYALGIGYSFPSDWQIELLYVCYKYNVWVEYYDDIEGVVSANEKLVIKEFIFSIGYNF